VSEHLDSVGGNKSPHLGEGGREGGRQGGRGGGWMVSECALRLSWWKQISTPGGGREGGKEGEREAGRG